MALADLSGNGHDGTFTATGYSWSETGPTGDIFGCLQLTGGERVNTGAGHNGTVTEGTLEGWFNIDDANTKGMIFEEGGTTRGINLYVYNGSAYTGWWNLGEGTTENHIGTPIVSGKWYHLALTWNSDADIMTSYVNGRVYAVTSLAGGVMNSHADPNAIGGVNTNTRTLDGTVSSGSNQFVGRVCEVRRWANERTQLQILANKNERLTGREPGLLAYWPGHAGTALGGTVWRLEGPQTPAKNVPTIRYQPTIYTDRTTGLYYVLQHDGNETVTLAAVTPRVGEVPHAPREEPTMRVRGKTVRPYVDSGSFLYELLTQNTQDRPILFGEKVRPLPQQRRYRLVLPENAV